MRLWHKDLIAVLPKQQLLGQWRECCCIARNIAVDGTPNHLLVNKVMDYPKWHFKRYAEMVYNELVKRGFRVDWQRFLNWFDQWNQDTGSVQYLGGSDGVVFKGWHNDRYFRQCYYNLQEKYDCGGITEDEWKVVNEWKTKGKRM